MVKGLAAFQRKMTRTIPRAVRRNLRTTMAVYAGRLVSTMEAFVPEDEGDLKNSIAWTWGEAPLGSLVIATVGDRGSDLRITVYAGDESTVVTNKSGGRFQNARIQEFGTMEVPASPYFYVSWRLRKRSIKTGLRKTVKKGLLEGSR